MTFPVPSSTKEPRHGPPTERSTRIGRIEGVPDRSELGGQLTTGVQEAPLKALERASLLLEPALAKALEGIDAELMEPVTHHMLGGGKKLRAALCLLSAEAAGASAQEALIGAVAIELVHNFSLIHDDVIDRDIERRHRSSVWVKFGIGAAIVAGDALSTLAMQLLLDHPTTARIRAAQILARATQDMIGGQAQDMAFEQRHHVTLAECIAMEAGKTAALLSCAASMGAVLAEAPEEVVSALCDYGYHLGIAFQAVDDVLGIWGDSAITGKPVGSDLLGRKKTVPVAMALCAESGLAAELSAALGLDGSGPDVELASDLLERCGAKSRTMELASSHLERCLAALEGAALIAGPASELAQIARYVVRRDR